jgi:hypothetical protein
MKMEDELIDMLHYASLGIFILESEMGWAYCVLETPFGENRGGQN